MARKIKKQLRKDKRCTLKLGLYEILLLLLLLVVSMSMNFYWGYYFFPHWYPHSVNIPSATQINNFCKSEGFNYGWLSSSSCKENQVQCAKKSAKKIMGWIQYKCIDWNKNYQRELDKE
jgi:hypothetical protein